MGFVSTVDEIMAFLKSKGYEEETGRGRHSVKMAKGRNKISILAHTGDMRGK
jgi:hypothetical protein